MRSIQSKTASPARFGNSLYEDAAQSFLSADRRGRTMDIGRGLANMNAAISQDMAVIKKALNIQA